jgi:hypothetical protein
VKFCFIELLTQLKIINLGYNSIFLPGFVDKAIFYSGQAQTGSRPLVHPWLLQDAHMSEASHSSPMKGSEISHIHNEMPPHLAVDKLDKVDKLIKIWRFGWRSCWVKCSSYSNKGLLYAKRTRFATWIPCSK